MFAMMANDVAVWSLYLFLVSRAGLEPATL
jgi:hypothetical protein